jgi:hypothetical protein
LKVLKLSDADSRAINMSQRRENFLKPPKIKKLDVIFFVVAKLLQLSNCDIRIMHF